MDESFIRELMTAAGGLFGLAVWYLRPRPAIAQELADWRARPNEIPRGLKGSLSYEWRRLVFSAREERIQEADCRRLLGLLALAREPISWLTVREFLMTIINCNPVAQFSVSGIREAVQILQPNRLLENGESILRLASEFFIQAASGLLDKPLVFFHRYFRDYVLDALLAAGEREPCVKTLAQGCAEWRNPGLRGYSLRNRFDHLLALSDWYDPFCRAFVDVPFMEMFFRMPRTESDSASKGLIGIELDHVFNEVSYLISFSPEALREWKVEFDAWKAFLENRIDALVRSPESYVQEIMNEFMSPDALPDSSPTNFRRVLALIEPNQLMKTRFSLRKVKGPSPDHDGRRSFTARACSFREIVEISRSDQGPEKVFVSHPSRDKVVKLAHIYEENTPHAGMVDPELMSPELYHEKCVAYSADRQYIAAANPREKVTVWHVPTAEVRAFGMQRRIFSVSFEGSDPPRLVVSDDLGMEWVYEVVAGESASPRIIPLNERAS
jgi:hypothetical protein